MLLFMTYSLDFRCKVLSVREKDGLTISEVANRFNVGISSVVRWIRRTDPMTTRNKPATKIDMEALKQDVIDYPDAYQYERATRLGVTSVCVLKALRRLGVSYKKNSASPKSEQRRTTYFSKDN